MAISDSIEKNVTAPKKVTIDGNSAEQQSLKDQIEADRYLASKKAVLSKSRGILLTRIKAPGTQ